jgi:hypothetical protein
MIKIVKDNHFVVCSQNSFDTMYKRLGYTVVNENQKPKDTQAKQIKIEEIKKNEIPVIEIKNEKTTKKRK